MVGAFFALSLYVGIVAYFDFQLANSTDAGIVTQAVASTAHGGVPPFFESWDCLFKQRCSFLLVHPSFLLYAAVPAFDLAPSPLSLFAIRAAVVALGAVPLFWLVRQLTGSDRWSLLASGLYLVWAPMSTDDFSLHMESFLPLEILLLVALWQAGRYRWGLLVAVATFVTIEVGPVFAFLVAVFFLVPSILGLLRTSGRRWRERRSVPFRWSAELTRLGREIRAGLRTRPIRYTLALMLASVAAYVVLFSFMNAWGAYVLGTPIPSTGHGLLGLFYDNSTPPPHGLSTILTSVQTISSAEYWMLLLALLGFVPLLSARAAVLWVPWVGWTFLSDSSRFTTLGHQYSLVAAGPLFVGFAFGLAWIAPRVTGAGTLPAKEASATASRRAAWGRPTRAHAWAAVVGIIVIGNLLLLPFSPVLPALGYHAGDPIAGNYFDHSLEIEPGWENVERLVEMVPRNASIAAPSALYAMIAAHPNAIVLRAHSGGTTAILPFNDSEGPNFALLYSELSPPLTAREWGNFSNSATYGMRAYVASTGLGSIFLYERGYSGSAEAVGPPLGTFQVSWTVGQGLTAGPIGAVSTNATAPSAEVIETDLASHRTGVAFSSEMSTLPAGTYTIRLELALTGVNGTVKPGATVLHVSGAGFGAQLFDENVTYGDLRSATWLTVSVNATLLSPLPSFLLQGTLRDPNCSVEVAEIDVDPAD